MSLFDDRNLAAVAHTFGRSHMEPPPLPLFIQQGQSSFIAQQGQDVTSVGQMVAGTEMTDLDQIVRNIGEW